MATMVVGGLYITRFVRKATAVETPEEKQERQTFGARHLKIGIVVFSLILLNGLRILVQEPQLWRYAIPGLMVDVLFIVVCWRTLRKLQKSQTGNSPTMTSQS
jgi:hypothetical protein